MYNTKSKQLPLKIFLLRSVSDQRADRGISQSYGRTVWLQRIKSVIDYSDIQAEDVSSPYILLRNIHNPPIPRNLCLRASLHK